MAQGIAGLVQHMILPQDDPMQVRLDGREVIRLQCGQQPIGAVI